MDIRVFHTWKDYKFRASVTVTESPLCNKIQFGPGVLPQLNKAEGEVVLQENKQGPLLFRAFSWQLVSGFRWCWWGLPQGVTSNKAARLRLSMNYQTSEELSLPFACKAFPSMGQLYPSYMHTHLQKDQELFFRLPQEHLQPDCSWRKNKKVYFLESLIHKYFGFFQHLLALLKNK